MVANAIAAALLASLAGCLVVTTEGPPLSQGQVFACSFTLRGEPQAAKQCGPLGDYEWVFEHFDHEIDPDSIACHVTGGICIYEPDHLGWRELHAEALGPMTFDAGPGPGEDADR